MNEGLGQWMRSADAARELGVTDGRIRQLIKQGVLRAQLLGPRFYIVEWLSVEQYKRARRHAGRPRQSSQ